MEPREIEDGFTVTFLRSRLPRLLRIECPDVEDSLFEHYRKNQGVLAVVEGKEVIGVIDVTVERWEQVAWLHHIVIAPAWRRKGIGSQLLNRGIQWAKEQGATLMFTAVPTKAFPATEFLRQHSFRFSGYHDDHFNNGDIAIFLTRELR